MPAGKSHIATIISDWGYHDPFAAAVKGRFLSLCPQAQLFDISHLVQPFNINQAAFILKNSYPCFPKNSWHIIGVETRSSLASHLIVKFNEHYFIGCDNGIYSIIFDEKAPDEVYRIKQHPACASTTFPVRDIYVPVLARIFHGAAIGEVASPHDSMQGKRLFMPVVNENIVTGKVLYIDRYENIYTNLHRSHIEKMLTPAGFDLVLKSSRPVHIKNISPSFSDVDEGDFVALFVDDYLLVAMNHGNAAGLFDMKEGDPVRIVF